MNALVKKADAEFGKSLMEAARQDHKDSLQRSVIGQVTTIMNDVDHYEAVIGHLQDAVERSNERLKAIEAGEFEWRNGRLTFTDLRLNKALFNLDNLASAIRTGSAWERGVE